MTKNNKIFFIFFHLLWNKSINKLILMKMSIIIKYVDVTMKGKYTYLVLDISSVLYKNDGNYVILILHD
ncbi:MAG: hypothetical protein A3K09_01130 [Nitrospinae bacterium RIFCSPLOWO2_12_FULL_47_7]|nr:MAG: hypothetical protein A3K09_01130 [Nitrospinae bacterium RIFCSPLOWO2_12_FULL_47_7]